ncbi:hypothetical protein GCM10009560_51250 [Nonomuraea longicatena]|uniref:Uncharacterized protein n=1 Tax=Nonomuraea longicatena TaxID=83682 RepID=A0ABP4ASI9_9ACTN
MRRGPAIALTGIALRHQAGTSSPGPIASTIRTVPLPLVAGDRISAWLGIPGPLRIGQRGALTTSGIVQVVLVVGDEAILPALCHVFVWRTGQGWTWPDDATGRRAVPARSGGSLWWGRPITPSGEAPPLAVRQSCGMSKQTVKVLVGCGGALAYTVAKVSWGFRENWASPGIPRRPTITRSTIRFRVNWPTRPEAWR